MIFVLFCHLNMHATGHYLRINVIKTISEDPRWQSSLACLYLSESECVIILSCHT